MKIKIKMKINKRKVERLITALLLNLVAWTLFVVYVPGEVGEYLFSGSAKNLEKPHLIQEVDADMAEDVSMEDYVLLEAKKKGVSLYEVWAIIQCESQWDDQATGVNKDLSIDRGLFQINSKWHKEVDNKCAYDYKCNTNEALNIRVRDGNWGQWSCSRKLGIK